MKKLNKGLLVATVACWTAFFCEVNNIHSYWLSVALFLGLIALTGAYIITKPSSIKVLSEEPLIEEIEMPEAWQECYAEAQRIQQNKEVEQILEELKERIK